MNPLKHQQDFRIRYKNFKLLFIEYLISPKFCANKNCTAITRILFQNIFITLKRNPVAIFSSQFEILPEHPVLSKACSQEKLFYQNLTGVLSEPNNPGERKCSRLFQVFPSSLGEGEYWTPALCSLPISSEWVGRDKMCL